MMEKDRETEEFVVKNQVFYLLRIYLVKLAGHGFFMPTQQAC